MKTLQVILIILAVLDVFGGLVYLTPSTSGVGIICFGCFLGILARICQAEAKR